MRAFSEERTSNIRSVAVTFLSAALYAVVVNLDKIKSEISSYVILSSWKTTLKHTIFRSMNYSSDLRGDNLRNQCIYQKTLYIAATLPIITKITVATKVWSENFLYSTNRIPALR